MGQGASTTLLFDADCRICTAFAHAVRALDVRRRLSIRAIQDSDQLLATMPAEARLASAHAVDSQGRVTSGEEAMPTILAALVAGPGLEGRLRASRSSMRALGGLYRIMREVRGQLTCGVAPASAARSPR